MPQIFPRAADTVFRLALWSVGLGGVAATLSGLAAMRSPYITGQEETHLQPVPFSHRHHVSDVGIDCRYCHRGVENSAIAGVPETQICMNCHRSLWTESEMLAPVRVSWRDEQPLHWRRVHDLPDYVYFDHSIHLHKGIGCYECHGRVGEMPLTYQAQPLTMQWCLDCHRDPSAHVRPRELVFEPVPLEELTGTAAFHTAMKKVFPDGDPRTGDIAALRKSLAAEYKLHGRETCYTCHR